MVWGPGPPQTKNKNKSFHIHSTAIHTHIHCRYMRRRPKDPKFRQNFDIWRPKMSSFFENWPRRPSVVHTIHVVHNACGPTCMVLKDSPRFSKILQDSLCGPLRGAAWRSGALGPPLFSCFRFLPPSLSLRSAGPPTNREIKNAPPRAFVRALWLCYRNA